MTKSMIERINTVSNAVEAVLGCPATNDQVVATIKAIETLGDNKKQIATKSVDVKPATKVVKPKVKKAKRAMPYINWSVYKSWFDTMLDGQQHAVFYSDMKLTVPESTNIRRSSWRNKLRNEAIARGYTSASVQFDDRLQVVRIEAIK